MPLSHMLEPAKASPRLDHACRTSSEETLLNVLSQGSARSSNRIFLEELEDETKYS